MRIYVTIHNVSLIDLLPLIQTPLNVHHIRANSSFEFCGIKHLWKVIEVKRQLRRIVKHIPSRFHKKKANTKSLPFHTVYKDPSNSKRVDLVQNGQHHHHFIGAQRGTCHMRTGCRDPEVKTQKCMHKYHLDMYLYCITCFIVLYLCNFITHVGLKSSCCAVKNVPTLNRGG